MTNKDQIKLHIGARNVESVLFEDAKAWNVIPDMAHFRDKWAVSRLSPSLRPTGRAAMLDFMNESTAAHEASLSVYFGREVTIDSADRNSVSHVEFEIDSPPDLEEMSVYSGFGSFRKGNRVCLTFWR